MHWVWNVASLLSARTLIVRRTSAREVFLTFDDGPHPRHTRQLLDVLASHQVPATFFLQGALAAEHGDIVREIVAAGHVIGNHSYSHPWFNRSPLGTQLREIEQTDRVLQRYDGARRHLFRPPHGRPALTTILLCALRRQRIVLWNRDSCDYRLSTEEVVRRLESAPLRPGDVVLFHDDSNAAPRALEQMLPRWKAAGLRFASL